MAMNIASVPIQPIQGFAEIPEPFLQVEKQASHVGRMMLPAGQTLTLQANIHLASQIPHPKPLQVEPPVAHNVKLLPLTALMPQNGIALGGAILQAIRTLKSESDRNSKESANEQKKKKKKSLKKLVVALMESAKDQRQEQEQEQSDERESPLKKRRTKRATGRNYVK